jgi:hypothetical protein
MHAKLAGTHTNIRNMVHDWVNEVVPELVKLVVLVLQLIASPV